MGSDHDILEYVVDLIIFKLMEGIEIKANYSIASRERAFLDTIYLNTNYHFDNLSSIDWKKCREILPIYGNKALNWLNMLERNIHKTILLQLLKDIYTSSSLGPVLGLKGGAAAFWPVWESS